MAVQVPRYQRQVGTPNMTTAVPAAAAPLQIGGQVTESAGIGAQNVGQAMAQAAMRIKNREDTAARAMEGSAISRELADDYRARLTSNKLMTSAQVQDYVGYVDDRIETAVNNHNGTLASKAALRERLTNERDRLADEASFAALNAARAIGRADMDSRFKVLNSSVVSDPSRLPEAYRQAETIRADYADMFTPEEEIAETARQNSIIAASAVEGFMNRGLYAEAADLVQMPGVADVMSPEQQLSVSNRLMQARERENAQWNAYRQNLQVMANAIGVTPDNAPTWLRAQAAGLQIPTAPQWEPKTDAGKYLADLEAVKARYGEGSIQLADFQAASQAEAMGDPPDLSDVAGMRKEFTGMSKDFIGVRDAYNKISTIPSENTPAAGDMSLIFSYMKMLDPGSTVREGEFATASQTTGVPGQIVNFYNKALTGNFLTPQQRSEFKDQARLIFDVQQRSQKALETNFARMANRAGMNPDDVIGPLSDLTQPADVGPTVAGAAGAPAATQPTEIEYGLDGQPLGTSPAPAAAPSTPGSAVAAEVTAPVTRRGGADGQIDPAIIDEIAAFAQQTPDVGQYFEQMANILDAADEAGVDMTLEEAFAQAKAGGGG